MEEPIKKKPNKILRFVKWYFGIAIAIGLLSLFVTGKDENSKNAGANQIGNTAPAAKPQAMPISDFQREFVQITKEYSKKYEAAGNALVKSALLTERLEKFRGIHGDSQKVRDWIGTVKTLDTTGDGNAYVSIEIAENLALTTWNVEFLDAQYKTLIPQSSDLFKKLMHIQKGDKVKFSGKFHPEQLNMTEQGKMTDPDFLFTFTDITKL